MANVTFKGKSGYGYIGPFADLAEADVVLAKMVAIGAAERCARITSYSSQVMTSDHSPVIINVTASQVDALNAA